MTDDEKRFDEYFKHIFDDISVVVNYKFQLYHFVIKKIPSVPEPQWLVMVQLA